MRRCRSSWRRACPDQVGPGRAARRCCRPEAQTTAQARESSCRGGSSAWSPAPSPAP
jgi:hypothetical protein